MESIEITVHFDENGTIIPLHFTWKGSHYHVESTGRRWQDEGSQHILVMVSNEHIYELTFISEEGRWYIGQSRPRRMLA